MTKQEALDQAAREAGYNDYDDYISSDTYYTELDRIIHRALDIYAQAAFEAERETHPDWDYIFDTFKDWNNVKIKITKVGVLEGGEVSTFNAIGQTNIGYIRELPEIGKRFYVWDRPNAIWDNWSTSVVTKIISPNKFETTYSVYEFEEIE